MNDYNDGRVECTADALVLHAYYFPMGSKRIAYSRIRSIQRVDLSAMRGRGRIWGTANPRYWANLDPGRPGKKVGLVVDCGSSVKPLVTPDDPDAVEALVRERANLGPGDGSTRPAPLM